MCTKQQKQYNKKKKYDCMINTKIKNKNKLNALSCVAGLVVVVVVK